MVLLVFRCRPTPGPCLLPLPIATPVTGAAARPTSTDTLFGSSTTTNSYGLDEPNAQIWPSRMTTSATNSTSAKRQRAEGLEAKSSTKPAKTGQSTDARQAEGRNK